MRAVHAICLGILSSSFVHAQVWLDPSFGIGGVVDISLSPYSDEAKCTLIQPDGKILVAGGLLARFDSTGNLDPTFGTGGVSNQSVGWNPTIADMALQTDGKIVLVGGVEVDQGSMVNDKMVLRFNSNGTLDNSFATDGVLIIDDGSDIYDYLSGVAIQSDGKIVIVGYGTDSYGNATYYIGRLTTSGVFDSTFAGGTGQLNDTGVGFDSHASGVAIMDDGRIVTVGSVYINSSIGYGGVVVRYLADGALDSTFSDDGRMILDDGMDMDDGLGVFVQADEKVLLTGVRCKYCSTEWSLTTRLLADGTRDTGFGIGGTVTHRSGKSPTRGNNVVADNSGHILVAGSYRPTLSEYDSYLVRLMDDGTPDLTFGQNSELLHTDVLGEQTPGIALQADGKIVLAGSRGENAANRNVLLLRYLNEAFVGVEDRDAGRPQLLSADEFSVALTSDISAKAEYEVRDVLGRLVDRGRVNVYASERSQIDFGSPLRDGAYVIILRDRSTIRSLRFLVAH